MKKVMNINLREMIGLSARIPDAREQVQFRPILSNYVKELESEEISEEKLEEIKSWLQEHRAISDAYVSVRSALNSPNLLAVFIKQLLAFWDAGDMTKPEASEAASIQSRPNLEQRRTPEEQIAWEMINRSN